MRHALLLFLPSQPRRFLSTIAGKMAHVVYTLLASGATLELVVFTTINSMDWFLSIVFS